jgi:hypothetical protein
MRRAARDSVFLCRITAARTARPRAGAPNTRFVRVGVGRSGVGGRGPTSDRAGVWGGAPPES